MNCYKRSYTVLMALLLSLWSVCVSAEPNLLWKGTFKGRIVKTSRLEDISGGKGAAFPLRAVMTETGIFGLDVRGKIKKEIYLKEYDKADLSDDGSTIALMKDREIVIKDLDGNRTGVITISEASEPQPVILPQHIDLYLSPDGRCLLLISYFTHTLYFYSRQGTLLMQHKFDDLRGAVVKFSDDGGFVAIHLPNWGTGNTSGYLLMFDREGRQLWRFDHKGCEAGFDISNDGNIIVLKTGDSLYSLDNEGRIVFENNMLPDNDIFSLSGDGKYIALIEKSKSMVSLFDSGNKNCFFSRHIKGFDDRVCRFTSITSSFKGNLLIVSFNRDWARMGSGSTAYIFDNKGELLWEHDFEISQAEYEVSSDGKNIVMTGHNEIFLYYLQ